MYLENMDPSSNGRTPVSKTVIPSEGVVLVRVQAGLPTRNRKPKTHPAILLEITCFCLLVINNASCKLKSRGSLLGAKPLQIQPTQAQALGRRQNRPQTVANQIQGARTLYIGSRAKLTYGRARTIEWATLQKLLRKHIVGLNPNRPCQPHPLVSRLLKMGGGEVSHNLSGIGTI